MHKLCHILYIMLPPAFLTYEYTDMLHTYFNISAYLLISFFLLEA